MHGAARGTHNSLPLDSDVLFSVLFCPILPQQVLDNFDRAQQSIKPEGAGQEEVNAKYVEMRESLMKVLTDELAMEKIPAVGAEFDYNLHMAIQQIPNDEYDEGIVCSEMQPGYTCKGQLVRAAYVMVSSGM